MQRQFAKRTVLQDIQNNEKTDTSKNNKPRRRKIQQDTPLVRESDSEAPRISNPELLNAATE